MDDIAQDQSNTRKRSLPLKPKRIHKFRTWEALVIACTLLMVAKSKQWLDTNSLVFDFNHYAIPEAEWKAFEARFSGKVVRQNCGAEYESASSVWNMAWSGKSKPAAVVIPKNEGAVAQALWFARRHRLCISVKGGGHSFLGLSVRNNCLVIWMKEFRKLTLNKLVKEVTFGAGLTFGDINPSLHNAGYGVIKRRMQVGWRCRIYVRRWDWLPFEHARTRIRPPHPCESCFSERDCCGCFADRERRPSLRFTRSRSYVFWHRHTCYCACLQDSKEECFWTAFNAA